MVVQLYKPFLLSLICFLFGQCVLGQVVLDSTQTNSTRYVKGIENLNALDSNAFQNIVDNLSEIAPELSDYIVTFGYGDIYEKSSLSKRDKQLIIIASLTTKGYTLPQLKFHINSGFNIGLEADEIKDVILQTLPYNGFPEVLNAMMILKSVIEERKD
ncbi:carboxymuconolactone decarboxylase family protein [Fulvivirga sp. M361]|uniref:carboxymuconolactone decarboxylase family protein n=1 Tax=Fulvivirga sp. M361 TaxID=2594266 RepID=UPI00117A569B|nr:carboxymuconolactone decarboxylase family protein [Fulvivirga sp. M361]TRX61459.1 carboxymuconolactone decarboxylase family protein [Fulvivirga sp. M361]